VIFYEGGGNHLTRKGKGAGGKAVTGEGVISKGGKREAKTYQNRKEGRLTSLLGAIEKMGRGKHESTVRKRKRIIRQEEQRGSKTVLKISDTKTNTTVRREAEKNTTFIGRQKVEV